MKYKDGYLKAVNGALVICYNKLAEMLCSAQRWWLSVTRFKVITLNCSVIKKFI